MTRTALIEALEDPREVAPVPQAQWAVRAGLLWRHRRLLARVTAVALVVSLVMAFTIPKRYKSDANILPPD